MYTSEFQEGFVVPKNPLGLSRSFELEKNNSQNMEMYDVAPLHRAVSEDAIVLINDKSRSPYPQSNFDLFPFFILLLLRTCGNPSPILNVRRDCLEQHPIERQTWLVHFDKPRGGSGDDEDYPWWEREDEDPLSPLNIIRFLLRWTEPLISDAPPHLKNKVFIYHKSLTKLGSVSTIRKPKLLEPDRSIKTEDGYMCLYHYYSRNKGLKPFSLRRLREATACNAWNRSRSILHVKGLLNHDHNRTTGLYLLSNGILSAAREEVSDAIVAVTDAFIKGLPVVKDQPLSTVVTRELRLNNEESAKILSGAWDTGLGSCSDPFNSPMPNQNRGKLCSAFWACIFCDNAIFALEHLPLLLARQKVVKDQALLMNDAAWHSKYERIDKRLERILNGYSEQAKTNALQKVNAAYIRAANIDVLTLLKTELTFNNKST
jgi:hypothetical protein